MLIRFKKNDGTEYPQWEEKRLGEISNIDKGQQISEENIDINGRYYHLNGGVTPSNRTNLFNREANTISISEGGNSCGYVKWNSEKFFSGGHNYTLQNIRNSIDDKYLFQFLKSIESNIMKLRVGGALPNIQKKDISKVLIKLPCFEEQQKIADFLSTVDQKISAQKAIVVDYEELKKGTMQKIFNQELRFRDDNGNEFPEWEKEKLGTLTTALSNKNKDNDLDVYSISNQNGFVPQNMQFEDRTIASENRSNYKVVEYRNYAYNPSRINVGSIAFLKENKKVIVSPLYVIFKCNEEKLTCEFLENYLKTDNFKKGMQQNIKGSVRESLDYEGFSDIKIMLPCLEEQKKIADCLSALDRKIEAEKKILADLEELKKGLLQAIFN